MENSEKYELIPQKDENGQETGYYTREPDGISGMSVSALAELCGVVPQTITQLLNRFRDSDPITNDLPDSLKLFAGKDLRLITNDLQGRKIIPDEACYVVLQYYAEEARDYAGKKIAQQNLNSVGKAGMRVFIWLQTGYIPQVLRDQIRIHTTVYIRRLENMTDHNIADHLWCTFREGSEVLLEVEKEFRVPINQMDLCDGSIGSHWSKYRQGKPWAKSLATYEHNYRDQRGTVYPNAFEYSELPYFRKWLREVYRPIHLPKYLVEKYGKRAVRQIYEELGRLDDHVLSLTEEKRVTPKQNELFEAFHFARSLLDSGRISLYANNFG
jgi:hypothetical protein